MFRVIDVIESCLVHVAFPSRYLALSYVWGKTVYLTTTKSNVQELEKAGAFNKHAAHLPRTIQDAILLTSEIGERYLWVDALCIVQDDYENKMDLINQMDKVYQGALCTIVAAAGTDSSAGLPGVSLSSPRKLAQRIINYGEERRIAISQSPFQRVLGQGADMCYWNKRAWTHQERLLSGRKLVFLEDGVHFNCQRMTWTEDVAAEKEDVKRHFQMYDFVGVSDEDVYFNGLGPGDGRSLVRKKDEYTLRGKNAVLPSFIDYCNLVHGHMGRDLTFEEDVLISFQGILNNISWSFGSFTQGMSDFYFS
ncbi:HET-domain-containing protein, partial [Dothidotthia symphoricarpi CBS 119687]